MSYRKQCYVQLLCSSLCDGPLIGKNTVRGPTTFMESPENDYVASLHLSRFRNREWLAAIGRLEEMSMRAY
jgi:hypothetical protein